jgi:hypothetical protein
MATNPPRLSGRHSAQSNFLYLKLHLKSLKLGPLHSGSESQSGQGLRGLQIVRGTVGSFDSKFSIEAVEAWWLSAGLSCGQEVSKFYVITFRICYLYPICESW